MKIKNVFFAACICMAMSGSLSAQSIVSKSYFTVDSYEEVIGELVAITFTEEDLPYICLDKKGTPVSKLSGDDLYGENDADLLLGNKSILIKQYVETKDATYLMFQLPDRQVFFLNLSGADKDYNKAMIKQSAMRDVFQYLKNNGENLNVKGPLYAQIQSALPDEYDSLDYIPIHWLHYEFVDSISSMVYYFSAYDGKDNVIFGVDPMTLEQSDFVISDAPQQKAVSVPEHSVDTTQVILRNLYDMQYMVNDAGSDIRRCGQLFLQTLIPAVVCGVTAGVIYGVTSPYNTEARIAADVIAAVGSATIFVMDVVALCKLKRAGDKMKHFTITSNGVGWKF